MIGIYIDDLLVIGKKSQIERLLVELKEDGINLKLESNLTDKMSCCVIKDVELNRSLILQPHLMNNLHFTIPMGFQGSNCFLQMIRPTSLTQIYRADTVLELECFCI
jgi:hypothetical protein